MNSSTCMSGSSTYKKLDNLTPVYLPSSVQILRIELFDFRNTASESTRSIIMNADNNIRYINMSSSSTPSAISGSIFGLRQLHTLDWSYGTLESLTPQLVDFPSIRNLNFSHNKLETATLQRICAGSPKLEDFDVSYNRLKTIAPSTFSNNLNIRHIKLGENALYDVELELSNLTRLETLSLHGNSLHRLSSKFIAELDRLSRLKNFTLDIKNNSFDCSCESVAFVRWIQTTNVYVISKDKLSCTLKSKRERLVDVSLIELEADCHRFPVLIISVISFLSGVVVIVVVIVWNRWYIMYRLILCKVPRWRRKTREQHDRYDAMVFYFANPTKPAESLASRKIAQWVINELRPLVEEDEDLKLYIADRDGTVMSKAEQFISAFQRSHTLVVCITPELLRDVFCMESIRYALASNKPLCRFIFINFCEVYHAVLPKQLRHLMQPTSGVTCLVWNENDAEHSDFWRRLRRSLNKSSAPDGCLGRTRRIPPNVSWSELEQMNHD